MNDNKKELTLDELSKRSNNGTGVIQDTPKSVNASDVAKQLQDKHGVKPPEKEKLYDSYTDQVVATLGAKISDEMFEQAKSIIEEKYVETQLDENGDIIEHVESTDINGDILDSEDDIITEYIEPTPQRVINPYTEDTSNIKTDIEEDPYEPEHTAEIHSYKEKEVDQSEDFDSLIDDLGYDMDEDEAIEIIRTKLKEKIKPITDKIDLDSFVISNDPVSIFKAFDSKSHDVAVADWALYDSGIPISIKEMRGYDIEKLNPNNSRRNEYNTFKEIYMTLYDHIVNEDKPTFEEFIRLVRYSDKKHLFFAVYRASFNKQNMLAYTCDKDKCNEIFIEEVDTDEMYKFKDKEAEARFNKILNDPDSSFKHKKYESVQVQISEDYVISVKDPSIFNVIFEMAALDDNFKDKYNSILGILSYVENIYQIDRTNNTLRPIELKIYENNLSKTVKYKIFNYAKIIQSLNSDQFYNITAIIGKMSASDDIQYIIPERICPKCKTVIEEYEQSPENMLFTRHQLAALANI